MPSGPYIVDDFSKGLDTRRSALNAPKGSLRILENAVINQGGEIDKRLAFVPVTTLPAPYKYLFGQGKTLHAFSVGAGDTIPPGTCPVPITPHTLADPGVTITDIIDVEAYNDKFQVTGLDGTGQTWVWYDGTLLTEPGPVQAHGTYSRTFLSKMYRLDGDYLRFSGTGDPSVTDPASTTNPGAGFINIAVNDPDGEGLLGMEVYYDKMAIFARLMTQLWQLDPDPSQDSLFQLLRIGTVAPQSIRQFGTGDILFLSDSGVRSLKALTINLAASVSDVGSAIDLILTEVMRGDPAATAEACSIVQPIQGRYWMFLKDTIYVLSYFPAGSITAWSSFPISFVVKEFAAVENRVFVRDTDNRVLLYGGVDGNTYDDTMLMRVRLPHLAADGTTTNKRVKSIDVICTNNWSVSVGMVPNNTELFELCANIAGTTLGAQSIPFAGYGTNVGVHLEHRGAGAARLSAVIFNVQEGWQK